MLASERAVDLLPTLLSLPAVRARPILTPFVVCSSQPFPLSWERLMVKVNFNSHTHFKDIAIEFPRLEGLCFQLLLCFASPLTKTLDRILLWSMIGPCTSEFFQYLLFHRTQARSEGTHNYKDIWLRS